MIQVLLVDDSAIFRKAVANVINSIENINVVGQCSDGNQVISFLENQKPDVILMDYQMPVINGVEATRLVKKRFPEIRIIGFSNYDDLAAKEAFFKSGANGFISKFEADNYTLESEINKCFSDN